MATYKRQLLYLLFVNLWPCNSIAEPVLNFTPDNGAIFKTTAICEQGGCSVSNQTRFATLGGTLTVDILEVVDIDGTSYIHQIMGDPADGFVQEVYVKHTSDKTYYNGFGFPSGLRIAPWGAFLGDTGPTTSSNSWSGGNGSDPLNANPSSIISGNGSANPNRVIMRQLLNDGEITMEFLKDKLDRKPLMTMFLNNPDITMTNVIDMRNSTYTDMNFAGVMINTMTLQGGGGSGEEISFNMATDSQSSITNAGRYTWTPGPSAANDYAGGDYNYLDGDVVTSAEMQAIDWSSYWDPFQPNPWTQYVLHPTTVGPNRPGP